MLVTMLRQPKLLTGRFTISTIVRVISKAEESLRMGYIRKGKSFCSGLGPTTFLKRSFPIDVRLWGNRLCWVGRFRMRDIRCENKLIPDPGGSGSGFGGGPRIPERSKFFSHFLPPKNPPSFAVFGKKRLFWRFFSKNAKKISFRRSRSIVSAQAVNR